MTESDPSLINGYNGGQVYDQQKLRQQQIASGDMELQQRRVRPAGD